MIKGTYQKRINWSECYDTDYKWTTCNWDVAGHLVFRISSEQAF